MSDTSFLYILFLGCIICCNCLYSKYSLILKKSIGDEKLSWQTVSSSMKAMFYILCEVDNEDSLLMRIIASSNCVLCYMAK